MRKWFSRHPRIRLVVVILGLALTLPLDLAWTAARVWRESAITAWDESAELIKSERRFLAQMWREAFPRKGA